MNPNKCPVPAPVTTIVYRTIQDVIDHVIIPAIKDANKNPDHYNVSAFADDWVDNVDSLALHGYFNTSSNIATAIEEYASGTSARNLRLGDCILINGMIREVITYTPVWVQNGVDVVTLILSSRGDDSYHVVETVPANRMFKSHS